MNKAELISSVSTATGVPDKTVKEVIETAFSTIEDRLAEGEKVSIVGFGSFDTAVRAPRNARNVQTGELIHIDARRVVRFKVGKRLKKRIAEE